MSSRCVILFSALALAVAACGARPVRSTSTSTALATCTGCHGDPAQKNAAPPRAVSGATDTADPAVGAHQSHLVAGHFRGPVACQDCHVVPASVYESGHMGGVPAVVRFDAPGSSGLALARGAQASVAFGATDPADPRRRPDATCNVYCHGATLDGGTRNQPSWAGSYQPGSSTLDCTSCHGFPPGGKHPGVNVSSGPVACARCHPLTVGPDGAIDLAGGRHINGVVDFAGGDACSVCHGDSTRQLVPGADPLAVAAPPPSPTSAAAGAHLAHVNPSPTSMLGAPVRCVECHARIGDEITAQHPDGTVDVDFGALASTGGVTPAFLPAARSCASVYCHGATLTGGSHASPSWDGGSAEAACGTCHGVPPPAPHPQGMDRTGCVSCHPDSVDASGNVKPAPAGKHLDGQLQGVGHDPSWMDTASSGFHAFSADRNLLGCTGCHGAALDGGSAGVACSQCHGQALPAGVTSWRQNCVMCHGGTDSGTGAPPRTTWGNSADLVRVGAHTAHVGGSALAPGYDCGVCHVKPSDALDPGHVDGATATVTFGGLAVAGGTTATWDRTSATCKTYCHGATLGGGSASAPVWTKVGQGQAACGTCHGIPPPSHAGFATSDPTTCNRCHAGSVDPAGNVLPLPGGQHLDGQIEATGGHGASWMDQSSPGFHAFSANAGLAACTSCHGPALDLCSQCHGQALPAGVTSWRQNCVMCHGGTDNGTGAPPRTTWGNSGDAVRVGAHSVHVAGSALAPGFGCGVCHVKPADALDPGHVDGPTATLTFGGLALPASGPAPAWNRTARTCSNTYCHGAFALGNAANAPDWTGSGQAACGTCHGIPPPAPHLQNASCGNCHTGYTSSSVNVATHLNGQLDVGSMTCTSCHGDPNRALVAGADPNTPAAPPVDTSGLSSSVAVGAHQAHLNGGVIASPIACSECHLVPSVTDLSTNSHPNGTVSVVFGTKASSGPTAPSFTAATATCSSTYCHGNYAGTFSFTFFETPDSWNYAGLSAAPTWSGSPMTCGSCHAMPPNGAVWHSGSHGYDASYNACSLCHPDATGTISPGPTVTGAAITNVALHVNGTVDVAPTYKTACFNCH